MLHRSYVEGSSQTLSVEELFFIPAVFFHSPCGPLLCLTPVLHQQPLLQFPAGMGPTTAGSSSGYKDASWDSLVWVWVWAWEALALRDMHCMTLALPMEMQGWSLFPEDLTGIFLRGKICCLTKAFRGVFTGL